MFMAAVAREGEEEIDVFLYFLADRLGKTIGELDTMPYAEYARWKAYHKVRQQQEELNAKAASHG